MNILTHMVFFLIGVVYPFYIIRTHKKENYRLKEDENYKMPYYRKLILMFWLLTILVVSVMFVDQSISLNFYLNFNIIGYVFTGLIILFIILQVITSKISTLEKAESFTKKIKDVLHYFPKSKHEFIWFTLLSISAGICEEIIFRLFIFSYLLINTNLAIAFIITNVIFALTHFDTSKQNMINSFVLGLLFTVVYYFANNIWLAVILHSSIDIYMGYLGYQCKNFDKISVVKD